jgi:hypothetical protein
MRSRFAVAVVPVALLGGVIFFGMGGGDARMAAAAFDVTVPGEGAGPVDWLGELARIDGRDLVATTRLVATFEPPAGGGGDSPSLTAPTANVVMDAWTQRPDVGQTAEDYDFVSGEPIELVVFAKIGEGGMPGGGVMDFVLIPAGINRMPPLPAPALFVDDVWFAPIEPGSVRLFTFSVRIDTLHVVFPPGSCIDWFASADFNATSNADVDANGFPDACIEANPARFLEAGSPDVDNVGANVLRFFIPGSFPLNIYQPHPPYPGPKAIGTKPGEDGSTRPWCFNLR